MARSAHTRLARMFSWNWPHASVERISPIWRAVHGPGQINAVAIAAATILKASLASRHQGQRLPPVP